MQTTLVIHPADSSTDFLKPIYENLKCNIISDSNIPHKDLTEAIKSHDRIIMMGHGSPDGLFAIQSRIRGYMINKEHVDLLKEKENNVYIWCNADRFVKKYNLKGFFTGMIISEAIEAVYFQIFPRYDEIKNSNELFSKTIKNNIHLSPQLMCENIQKQYKSEHNPIIKYNQNNIYHL